MDTLVTISFVLIGLGGVAAGFLGLALPPSERIGAGLPLVAGAGVGVAALAIGAKAVNGDPTRMNTVLLIASALGLVATLIGLALLWRRTGPRGNTSEQRSMASYREDPERWTGKGFPEE